MNTDPPRTTLTTLRLEAGRCRRRWQQCECPVERARLATELAQADEAVRVYLEGYPNDPEAHP